MRFSPRRWSGSHTALVGVVVGVLLFSGAPLAAWSAPTPDSTPTPSSSATDGTVKAQDETAAKDAASPSADDKTASDSPSPSEKASPSDDATASEKPSDDPTSTESATPEESESPSDEPTATPTSSPSTSKTPSVRVSALAVPPATGNNAVISVKVGGNRTSTSAVSSLAGVVLGFYDAATGGSPVYECTSDVDGDCSIVVPNTQSGGANRDRQFWVRQISAPGTHYTNPNLGTGDTVASDPYRFQTCTQLRAGNQCLSTQTGNNGFMLSTGTTNNEASGGIWQNSLNNPEFPAKCGINVAILHDLSNSVTAADLTAMKGASTGFVNALVGTPSQVSTFTFASTAPAAGSANATLPLTSVSTAAGAATVNARINGMTLPGGADGGTNWDRGIYQVAQSASTFDVLVVITDGNPTYYGNVEGPGGRTRFREVENGIFSANAVKAEGSKLLAVGVGAGVTSAASGLNLRAISGPTLNTDYYQTSNYAAAGTALRNLALGKCAGSISVVKQAVPFNTPTGSTTGAQPQGGWDFTGAGTTGITFDAPATRTTATGTGAVNFPLTFDGGVTSGTVTVTETQQAGYELHQGVTGQNAVCTRVDTGANIVPGNVTNGFTVSANSDYPISCVVYNKAPAPLASVVVNKTWRITSNGTTTDYTEGNQPTGFVAGATISGTVQGWGVERTGFRQGDQPIINEAITSYPPQCTVTSRLVVLANGATVSAAVPYTATLIAGQNTYTIRNTITCQTRLSLVKEVNGGTEPVSSWTLDAVAPGGALAGPNGTSGSAGATGVAVSPGVTYPLAEAGTTTGALNYTQFVSANANLIAGSTGSWTCAEVAADGTTVIPGFSDGLNGGVNVPLGRWVRCTASNRTATLALRKVVQNTHGGTAVPANWNLTATPTGTYPAGLPTQTVTGSLAGASFNVRPGVTYAITESGGPSGYTNTSTVCDTVPGDTRVASVTPVALDVITCTFTNDDTPATLTLRKTVSNDNGGTAQPTAWTLNASGPTTGVTGATGSATVTNVPVSAGNYALSESNGPAGYTAGNWSCTGGTVTGSSVAVSNGANVVCTINNDDIAPRLTLIKTVTNDNGGTAQPTAWTLTATGPTSITGITGTPAVTNQAVSSGTYTLTESGGPAGYTPGSWVCTGVTNTGSTLVLTPGSTATCTINNNDQGANLTLIKTVTNDNGGTASPTAWTLAAGGATPISGVTGTPAVTNAAVSAGSYTLSESGGPSGYTPGLWSCTGGTLNGSIVVVPNGGNVTCTINNNDQAAQLTLRKVVNNGTTGATAVPANWTLTATGPTPVTGPGDSPQVEGVTVSAGTYNLSEADGPAGYTASAWTCTGGTVTNASVVVPNGGDVVCTITNTAQQSYLTLRKTVTNDNGGTAEPTDWTLTATGPITVTGRVGDASITRTPIPEGDYVLTEAGPGGYIAGAWTCTGVDPDGNQIYVGLGKDVICTINNNDRPGLLTLRKVVNNGATGATAEPSDWTLSATGPTPITGAGDSAAVSNQIVNAGNYTLSESNGPAGYNASTWNCGDAVLAGAVVTVPNGGDVTCTITNTAQPVSLTLVKVVDNGTTGATTPATAWALSATGPVVIEGSTPVTAAAEVGTYDLSEDGPDGYDASDWVCTGAASSTDDSVTLALGNAATCTITNTAQQPTLTLIKSVTNDNGGSAVATDWTLSAAGPTTGVTGTTGAATITDRPVAIGSYALTESGPTGYTAGSWVCTGGTQTGASVAVALGDDVICRINNNDQPGQLTLIKVVDANETGSGKVPADWTLTAAPQDIEGQNTVSGNGDPTSAGGVNAVEVFAGDYDLSETGPAGFDPGDWECTGGVVSDDTVAVPSGGNVICRITNTAIAPRLTLVKTVINDNGGTAADTAWTLSADGPSPISGAVRDPSVTDAAVEVGTYTLDETGPGGYTASDWTCRNAQNATFPIDGASVTLAEGDDVTCTVTNNDVLGTWTLTKSSDPVSGSTVQPGDEITYTVTATKTGGVNPVDRVVNDDLSQVLNNATLVTGPTASTGTASITGTTLTWDIPSLSGVQTVTYTVRVNAGAYNVRVGNVVTGEGSSTCPPGSTACTTEHFTPHYTLVKTSNPASGATVLPGNTIAYTLTVHNDSQAVLYGATVTDDLSNVLNNAALGTVGPGGSVSGTTLTWTVPTVQPGNSTTLTYTVTVNAGAYNRTIGNVATPGPGGQCVEPNDCTTTHPTPHYTLTKESDPESGQTVNPGQTITYTLRAHNDSQGVVSSATVTDDLSDVLDNATLEEPLGAGLTLSGTTLTWTFGELSPGRDATVSYTVTVNADAYRQTIGNVATPGPEGNCVEPNDCTTTHPTPHWTLTKTSNPATGATVSPGDTITYTLTAHNDSQGVVTGGTVTDNLANVLNNATLGTVGAGGAVTGTTLTWTVPTLQPDDTATLSYTVTVDADAYNVTIGNVATPGPGGECEEPNNCTTSHPTPHWVINKSSNPATGSTVLPGEVVTYTLTAYNDSDGTVRGARATDNLSDVLDNATLGTIGAGGSVTGTTLTWNIPTLEPGNAATLTYTVTVNADAYSQTLHNVVTPGNGGECAPLEEVTPDGVRAAALVNAQAAEDCETTHFTPGWTLEKSSDPASGSEVDPGDQVTYTLTVTNTSAAVVTTAVVTDDLSDVLEHASLDSVPSGASLSGTTLTWKVPTLQSGEVAELSYTVRVDDDAYDVSFANVATPGNGGDCIICTTYHDTPPKPHKPHENLPNTGGTSVVPLGLGAGFLIVGGLMLAESRRRRQTVPVKVDPKR